MIKRQDLISIISNAKSPESAADDILKLIYPKQDVDWAKLLKIFNDKTGKSHRIVNNTVKSKIKARLREGYTKQDIIKAITNAANDDFHKEGKYRYLTLDYIGRADIIDRYTNIETEDDKIKLGLKL
jgi:uncharacterized phage protein (TIGR02220 family)